MTVTATPAPLGTAADRERAALAHRFLRRSLRPFQRWPGRISLYCAVSLAALLVIFPIYMLVLTSLMPSGEASAYPPVLFSVHPTLQHFRAVFRSTRMLQYLVNSLVVSGTIMAGQLVTACLAAYAFAYLRFRGRQALFLLFLATLMVPAEVSLVPNFLTINALGWRNTYQALTVPFLATAFGTFLLRQFFLSIPAELRDAARIDGCGHLRFLRQIVVPLSRPALATLAVNSFLAAWNMYLWPLIVADRASMRTIQIGIRALQNGEAVDRGLVTAGAVIAVAPTLLIILVAQRHIVRGLTAGAVKG